MIRPIRFSYWVNLVEQQSHILVPTGLPSCPIQLIDVRDLAKWVIARIELGSTGAFNAVGPKRAITIGEMFSAIATGLGKSITIDERPPRSSPHWEAMKSRIFRCIFLRIPNKGGSFE